MKKLILSAILICIAVFSFAQDDVYRSVGKRTANTEKYIQVEYDKFDDVSRVSHKPFMGNNDFRVNCRFIIKDKKPTGLILRVVHYGREWLFVNKLTFLIDNKKYELEVEPNRLVEGGYTVEQSDIPATGIAKDVIEALMKSDNVELRYTGKSYTDDAKQLKRDIERLRRVVNYYKSLGGTF